MKELSQNASRQFSFRSPPDDCQTDSPVIIPDKFKSPKSVSFDEQKNVVHLIPPDKPVVPNPCVRPTPQSVMRQRPKRTIRKPIRYTNYL